MKDCYLHTDINIIYVDENVPGPSEQSEDYTYLANEYNSQVTHSCHCDSCTENSSCKCLEFSGGQITYQSHIENGNVTYRLSKLFDVQMGFIIECNDLCSCPEGCGNRVVQHGPIKGLFVKVCDNTLKGFGLFTHNFIAHGTFICEYAGELITKDQALFRHNVNQQAGKMNYIFCLSEYCNNKKIQTFVDPSYIGNIGRYINHSCEPNCRIIPVRVNSPIPKLAIFSSVDILPGMELNFDYGCKGVDVLSLQKVENEKKCLCDSPNCRKVMPFNIY